MTNFTYYKDEIFKILEDSPGPGGFAMKNNSIVSCNKIYCDECKFNKKNKPRTACVKNLVKWLYEEHVEIPLLMSKERYLLKALESGFLARNKNGDLYYHKRKPVKGSRVWYDSVIMTNIQPATSNLFSFIRWEDSGRL